MSQASPSRRAPLTDSPWYWLYVFATAGLIALVLMGPKFAARQAQIERNYQAHQRANEHRVGLTPDTPLSSREHTYIRLWPLYVMLFSLLAVGWIGVWWRRYHRTVGSPIAAAAPLESRTETKLNMKMSGQQMHVRNTN